MDLNGFRHFVMKEETAEPVNKFLSSEILDRAEVAIIKHVQRQHFPEEMKRTESRKNVSTRLRKLDPVVVEGILRVGGRLSQAEISLDAKHPIILPKESHVTTLIIRDIHNQVGHLGKNVMLAILCQKYWILHASTLIKSLVAKCVICRKYQARVIEQKMSDLPLDRVTPGEPPFTSVGMDYFGPIIVKRGRGTVKRYGVVFTCLAIRAVHLEVACSLDTDSCINAVKRFIARRGPVKSIRSDNGTNLVACERELCEEMENWNHAQINKHLMQKNVSWNFNPPAGSHHGGVWERVIRTVRKVLYSLLHQQVIRLDDECLVTLFCEVESIITTSPNDPHDLAPLTPNHLLLNKGGEKTPPGMFNKTDCYMKRRWR
ncbi:uncharacterized protein [Haliotis asinina]|uniref:uncharacterized protein n=1 Tax=Haliotis asinina TaxID=109174 RepID=UPI00353240C7